ncbi:8-amino-7-oxononanoate synthase [Magnetovirga frankeli]|uniref:8-amino-7-oxononanoate synthase n=1 Tax=Magnetovirga frankeli TaxID=947516 RepID=UPI00129308E3|nr:8-amino-7-oxononanoate synthase [gamma proteobacterium SS-5]
MKDLSADLQQTRQQQRYRSNRVLQRDGVICRTEDGRELLAFCSNDYLGLSQHPQVVAAFQRGAERYGVGSGAAHLINGHGPAHQALEEELAEFLGRPRALLFSTGYMANLALISTLLGRGDWVVQDRLNHASLLDGAQLSRARLKRYAHADLADARQRLTQTGSGATLLATDGVFSMDGDLAPLAELQCLCSQHHSWLLLDDAHGFGVLGKGRGTAAHYGLTATDDLIQMITLGKALGTFGAAVVASEAVIETLIQRARPYIFTTASPPANAEASRAALRLLASEHWRREHLQALIARFRQGAEQIGLPLMASTTPIQPLLLGSEARALAWSRGLEQAGILVSAIRPPTVPQGASRLRITLSAEHSPEQVDRLLDALQNRGQMTDDR